MSLDVVDILSRLSSELGLLPSQNLDKRLINAILDELTNLDFKHAFINKHVIETFIDSSCQKIKPSDGFTVVKACNIMCRILGRSHVRLNANCAQMVVKWLTRCALESSELVLVDILQALQKVLYGNGQEVKECYEDLLGESGILLGFAEISSKLTTNNDYSMNSPEEVSLLALQCIQALTFQSDDNKSNEIFLNTDIAKKCCDLCLKTLYKSKTQHQDETNYCKLIICCLSILANLFSGDASSLDKKLSDTLGLCRGFMVYCIQPDSQLLLQKLTPSQQTVAELPNNARSKGGKRPKVRKQRNSTTKADSSPSSNRLLNEIIDSDRVNAYQPANCQSAEDSCTIANRNIPNWRFTSDSEMSDSEAARETKLKGLQAKLRYTALMLISVVIKTTDRREFFSYWWAFLPSSPDTENWSNEEGSRRNLTFCVTKEPTSSGRAMALGVILSMVTGSRLYLSQAEMSKRSVTPFIPFSVTLGHIVSCLHKVMCTVLKTERTLPVLIQALKCVSAIVQATPYHRLEPSLIAETVDSVKDYLCHKDVTIQVAALICMGCIMSIDPQIDIILQTFLSDDVSLIDTSLMKYTIADDDEIVSDEEINAEEAAVIKTPNVDETYVSPNSWLVEICFRNLGWRVKDGRPVKCHLSPLPVRLESLQVLSAISHHHFSSLLLNQLGFLSDILCSAFDELHPEISVHAAKCIGTIGDAMLKPDQNTEDAIPVKHLVRFWTPLVTGPLTNLLQSEQNSPAKAIACDCIASIGEKAFDRLKRNLQVLIITLLFGSCSDEDPLVRAAAVRALAICVTYTTLRQDICFVSDCGESILRTMSETIPAVKVKASWALGNLSDALVNNMNDPEAEAIDDNLLMRLFDAAIFASNGNEKLKMNAMRSLGNLLRLISSTQIENHHSLKGKVLISIQRLVEVANAVSNVKIKWNACYAIGNVMKNEILFSSLSQWQGSVFECLVKLVTENHNLKVRINAAVALRSPSKQTMYGSHFPFVWDGVMNAMENCNDISDFTEYKHKDNLMEQLCVTLAHLTCLLSSADLSLIEDALCFHGPSASSIASHVKRKVLPQTESASKLLAAAMHVTSELEPRTETQRHSLSILQDIFVLEMY